MRRAGKLAAFCLLFCAGCGGEEAASFRGRDAGQWANALAAEDTQASAYETLRAGGYDALPVLRALLKSDPPLAALAAGELIGALGPRADAALPDLIEALGRTEVRGMAVTAIGRLGPASRKALGPIRALLTDEDGQVAMAAALASWRIARDADGLDALVHGLTSGNPVVRAMAVQSLGQVGKPAVDALIGTLSHEDGKLRASAADALGSIGPDARRARPALYAALKDPSAIVRAAAERALSKLRD